MWTDLLFTHAYVDYSRLFFRVYVLLFSIDLLYSVNPVIIIIYKILHLLAKPQYVIHKACNITHLTYVHSYLHNVVVYSQ